MVENKTQEITSPCIRNCCLNNDDICIGCKRTLYEILHWSEFSWQKKAKIVERLEQKPK